VQRAAHQYDAALATLAKAPTGEAAAPFLDVRGDVLLDKGDKAGALAAWRDALSVKTPGLINRELVELKANALSVASAASASSTDGTSTLTSKKP
jgi:predicted negative regulator of RcsB-dependent stress response